MRVAGTIYQSNLISSIGGCLSFLIIMLIGLIPYIDETMNSNKSEEMVETDNEILC